MRSFDHIAFVLPVWGIRSISKSLLARFLTFSQRFTHYAQPIAAHYPFSQRLQLDLASVAPPINATAGSRKWQET
jgi:hypothetical protein